MTNLDLALEQLRQISLDLPASERLHYGDIVMEAVTNGGKEGAVLYNLYKELDKINDVEYGRIPDSKGDLTKYAYYDHMMKCIEVLSGLENAESIPNITRMNKLHNILLGHREDFVFGYKRNIDIITTAYVTLVLGLNAMIDFSISDYTKYLNLDFNDRTNAKFNRKESMLISQMDEMIKLFENGGWSYIIRLAKKTAANNTQEMFVTVDPANEAIKLGDLARKAISGISKARNDLADNVLVDNTPGGQNEIKTPFKFVLDMLKNCPTPVKIVVPLISLFLAMRGAMFVFGRMRGTIANFARNQSALLKAAIDANAADGSTKGVKAQTRMVKMLDGFADLIDSQYKKAEDKAKKDLTESNKANLGTDKVVMDPTPSGVDFGL